VGRYRFAPGSSSFIIGLARLIVEVSTSSRMDTTSITTSEFVATRVDFLAFGVDFLASGVDFLTFGVDFFRFPPFLTKSFA
jgi:hypothetical protein